VDVRRSYSCIACGARSPEVETEHTLISSRFGWRLTRQLKNEELILEWRCARCWQRYKQERALEMTPPDGITAAAPSSEREPSSGERGVAPPSSGMPTRTRRSK